MNRREFHIRLAAAAAALACLPATARAGSARTARGRQAAGAAHDAAMTRFMEDLAQGDPAALEAMQRERRIAMLAYPGMFPLDLLGPHAVFTGLMNTRVHIVWKDRTPISDMPGLNIVPNVTFTDCPDHIDVLFVPGGGMGTIAVMRDREVLNFLRRQAATARYVTSVCTGALVLGAAGLLKGYRATTYWAVHDLLPLLGAKPVRARLVEDRNRITAGGVTAGIDFGLLLAAQLAGENYTKALQLNIEYDPAPPFDAGSPESVGEPVAGAMRTMYAEIVEAARRAAEQTGLGSGPP